MEPATPNRNLDDNHGAVQPLTPAPAVPVAPAAPVAPVVPAYPTSTAMPAAEGFAPGSQWPGAFAAIGMAFEQLKKNPQPAIAIVVVYAVLGILDVVVGGGTEVTKTATSFQSHSNANFTAVGSLIFLLALPIYTIAIADRRTISLSEFYVFKPGRYFSILGAAIALSMLFALTIVALFIPLIWFIPWFSMITFLIVDANAGMSESFGRSKALAKHHKGKVWGVIGATILLSIPAGIFMAIPKFGVAISAVATGFLSILTYSAMAMLYRWLQHNELAATPAPIGQQPVVAASPVPPVAPQPPVATPTA